MIRLKKRTAADLEPWTWFVDELERVCLVIRHTSGRKQAIVPLREIGVMETREPSECTVKTVRSPGTAFDSVCPKYACDLRSGTWFLDNRDKLCCVLHDEYFGRSSTRRQRVMSIAGNVLKIEYALSSQICVKRVVDPSELEFV